MFAVRIDFRDKDDGHAGERTVSDEGGSWRLTEVRGDEGAHAGAERVRLGVQRAVPAGEIVAEGQLGVRRRVRVADGRGVAGDNQFAQAQGAHDPPPRLGAGTVEDASEMWWLLVILRSGAMKCTLLRG